MPDRYSDPDDDDREERERRYDYAEAARRGMAMVRRAMGWEKP